MNHLCAVVLLSYGLMMLSTQAAAQELRLAGDADRGRLEFGKGRTCHYAEAIMGQTHGPTQHRITKQVAGM